MTAPVASGFEARAHPFWSEPTLDPVPTRYEAGQGAALHARLPAGATFELAGQTKTSCGHDLEVQRLDGRRVVFRAWTGGFEFAPEATRGGLSQHVVLAPTLLRDDEGEAFALLSAGTEVAPIERVDARWSRVGLLARPNVVGVVRDDRIGGVYRPTDAHSAFAAPGEQIELDRREPFDLLDRDGAIRAPAVTANAATLIDEGEDQIEVAVWIDLELGPWDAGSALVHGFVRELPRIDGMGLGISGWGGGGGGTRGPQTDIVEGAWLHTEPATSTRVARAYHDNVSAALLERGADWSRVAVDTVWGPVEGFVQTRDLRPSPASRTFLSRDMAGDCRAD